MAAAKLSAAIVAGLAGLIATQAAAQVVTFYEDNNCRKAAFRYPGAHPVAQSCKGGQSACRDRNDVARSVRVVKPAWMTVRVYVNDDPYGGMNDDWAALLFEPNAAAGAPDTNICVGSFERNTANAAYWIKFRRFNGLDGKVSYVKTEYFGRQGIPIR